MSSITVVNSSIEMQRMSSSLIRDGKSIAFVPTMGALHEGHLSLVSEAKKRGEIVVVSIFVNPTQFGENEDLDKYIRDFEGDKSKLEKLDVDIIFAPTIEEIYPSGYQTYAEVRTLQDCLCGAHRSGHFIGVCTVVLKLFNIVNPDFAVFGEKDYQQLKIIQKMVKDLNLNIEIIPMPIVREKDGLAMSSRNKYLNPQDRESAVSISKSLIQIKNAFENGCIDVKELIDIGIGLLSENNIFDIDYFEIRDSESLTLVKKAQSGNLVAVAAKVGETRLIDNIKL